jgi:hypothetical protein
MYSAEEGVTQRDVLWNNARLIVFGILFIVSSLSRIFSITPTLYVIEWIVIGVAIIIIIWSTFEIIRNITKIRKARMYALPFTTI